MYNIIKCLLLPPLSLVAVIGVMMGLAWVGVNAPYILVGAFALVVWVVWSWLLYEAS